LPRTQAADPILIADLLAGVLMQRAFFTGGRIDGKTWKTVVSIVVSGLRAAANVPGG